MNINSAPAGLLAAFMVIAFSVRAAQAADTNTNRPAAPIPVIQFEDVELTTVIQNLARQAEVNFLFDPKTALDRPQDWHHRKQPRVSLNWTNLTADQALAGVLAYYGLHRVEIVGTTVSKITLTNLTAGPADTQLIQSGTNTVIPLIQMSMVPLADALTNLARHAKLDIALDTTISSSDPNLDKSQPTLPMLSLRWKSITAHQALAALCENYDLSVTRDPTTGVIQISRREAVTSK